MIKTFFLIRLKQLLRTLAEIGLLRVVVLLVILLSFLAQVYAPLSAHPWVAVVVFSQTILSLHMARKDRHFISVLTDHPEVIFAAEYFILSVPVLWLLALSGKWLPLLLQVVLLSLIPFFKRQIASVASQQKVFSWLPGVFEWQSGLRKNWIICVIFYALGIWFASYPTAIPIALLVLSLITTSFALESEPLQMLEVFELSPSKLLKRKILNQLKIFWLFTCPLILLYVVMIPGFWFVMPVMIVVCSTLLVLSVVLKYSSYQPGENLPANSLTIAVGTVCFFFPFLAPIPFILAVRNYRKAIKNLNEYLYAYC